MGPTGKNSNLTNKGCEMVWLMKAKAWMWLAAQEGGRRGAHVGGSGNSCGCGGRGSCSWCRHCWWWGWCCRDAGGGGGPTCREGFKCEGPKIEALRVCCLIRISAANNMHNHIPESVRNCACRHLHSATQS